MGMCACFFQTDPESVDALRQNGSWDVIYAEENRADLIDIDKSWHVIHYVLNGTAWETCEEEPLSQLILGGAPLNEEDMGYGPPRLLSAALVKEISEALAAWDETAFRARFDLKAMLEEQIYPLLEDEDGETLFEYAWEYFQTLKVFIQRAVGLGRCVLAFIE